MIPLFGIDVLFFLACLFVGGEAEDLLHVALQGEHVLGIVAYSA